MKLTTRLPFVALLICSGACAAGGEPMEVRGIYFYNFENAALTPEGQRECWEARGDMSAAELPAKGSGRPWGRSKVVVRGVLSEPGKYGNMGTCTHAIDVTEVLSVEHLSQGP